MHPSLVACFLSILPVHAQAWFTYKEALATGSPRILEYHQNSKELSKTGSHEEKVCEKPLWDVGLRQRLCCLAGGLDEMFASGFPSDQRPATTSALSRLKTGSQRPPEYAGQSARKCGFLIAYQHGTQEICTLFCVQGFIYSNLFHLAVHLSEICLPGSSSRCSPHVCFTSGCKTVEVTRSQNCWWLKTIVYVVPSLVTDSALLERKSLWPSTLRLCARSQDVWNRNAWILHMSTSCVSFFKSTQWEDAMKCQFGPLLRSMRRRDSHWHQFRWHSRRLQWSRQGSHLFISCFTLESCDIGPEDDGNVTVNRR